MKALPSSLKAKKCEQRRLLGRLGGDKCNKKLRFGFKNMKTSTNNRENHKYQSWWHKQSELLKRKMTSPPGCGFNYDECHRQEGNDESEEDRADYQVEELGNEPPDEPLTRSARVSAHAAAPLSDGHVRLESCASAAASAAATAAVCVIIGLYRGDVRRERVRVSVVAADDEDEETDEERGRQEHEQDREEDVEGTHLLKS